MCTGCPRAPIHESALQLLQLLDKRFFGTVGLLPADDDNGKHLFCTLVNKSTTHGTVTICWAKLPFSDYIDYLLSISGKLCYNNMEHSSKIVLFI